MNLGSLMRFIVATKIVPLVLLGVAGLSLAAPARAQESDAEGCKDAALLSRYPKSSIYGCDHKDFDAVSMQTVKDGTEAAIEGEVNILNYSMPPDASDLAVYRNVRMALAGAGYGFLFEQSPSILVARKGAQYIQLLTGGGAYTLNMVKQQAMEQVVTADAASMGQALNDVGHVAVYGFQFETGKATLLASADPTLQQVLKLMQQNPLLKLRVEGHSDNVGKRDTNQPLSEKRAVAVVDWLVAHGIPKARLTAQGFADSKPLADNGTEEGRAKNRRVELVKIP
ncbi:MAG: OmpA family protein [Acidobacteriaceae bacterium]